MKETTASKWESVFQCIWGLFCWALISLGVLIFVGQTLLYLYSGEWLAFPLIMLVPEPFDSWLSRPKEWVGLSRILSTFFNNVPVTLFMVVSGFIMTHDSGKK